MAAIPTMVNLPSVPASKRPAGGRACRVPAPGPAPRLGLLPGQPPLSLRAGGRRSQQTWCHQRDESEAAQAHLSAALRIRR